MKFFPALLLLAFCFFAVQESYAVVTEAQRMEILRAHNHVRSLASPTATNMRRMVSLLIMIIRLFYKVALQFHSIFDLPTTSF